jgi:hypothetical protein
MSRPLAFCRSSLPRGGTLCRTDFDGRLPQVNAYANLFIVDEDFSGEDKAN